jgi:hypothetical protein
LYIEAPPGFSGLAGGEDALGAERPTEP